MIAVHRLLRERTRDLHAVLDARMLLGMPGAGRAQYAQHVAAMYGWLCPIEAKFRQYSWPADLEPSERWHKSAWLQQDIAAARDDGFLPSHPSVCTQPADLTSAATRYGWAYVIEGSMLGGQVLMKRLADRVKPWPMRYLQGYGAAAGIRWRAFLAALERDVRHEGDIESAARGAVDAFTSIGLWLRARGVA